MKENRKASPDQIIKKLFMITLGIAIYTAGVHFFTVPANIIPGGATGISTAINYVTGMPIGVLVLLINTPLLILAFLFIGKSFALYTLFSTVMFTVFNDVIYASLPVYEGEKLIACCFGSALLGIGVGIVLASNSSTGGTDIVILLIRKKAPHLSVGTLMQCLEFIIILTASLVYRSVDAVLYSIFCVFVASFFLQKISDALEEGRIVFISSKASDEIRKSILADVHRGVTVLHGKGGYEQEDRAVLLCAVRKKEFFLLKRMVKEIDPEAFIMAAESADIAGKGFKAI